MPYTTLHYTTLVDFYLADVSGCDAGIVVERIAIFTIYIRRLKELRLGLTLALERYKDPP